MTEPENLNDDGGSESPDEDQFRLMRARANQASKLERENARLAEENSRLRRDVAFTSAGLSLTDKQQAALLAAHGDTDLSADALRATAIELGFAKAEPNAEDQQREQAIQAQGQIAAAQAGAATPDPVPNLDQQILAAQQSGDLRKVMQLKAAAALNLHMAGKPAPLG